MTSVPRLTAVVFFLLAVVCLGQGSAVAERHPLTLGVLAFRPIAETVERWQPLADYLSRSMDGRPVALLAANYEDLEGHLARGEIDFVLTNPSHYIELRARNSLSGALATMIVEEQGHQLTGFGGVIIARSDRGDINSIRDLRGKTVAAVAEGSLGGYRAQAFEMMEQGINLHRDVHTVFHGMPHDGIVEGVLSGRFDAGFVRTGVIEDMTRRGRLDPTRIKVLDARSIPGFPFALSTRLYPEWPFVAMPHMDRLEAKRVAAALLLLDPDESGVKGMEIAGFGIPADYQPVEDLARMLRLPPYDAAPDFGSADVWNRYRWQIVAGIMALALIGGLTLWLVAANRRLREARARDEQFRILFESAAVSVMVHDRQSAEVVEANRRALESYGVDDMAGLHEKNVWCESPYSYDDILDRFRLVREKGPQRFEWKSRSLHGNVFWEDVSLHEINLGGVPRIVSTAIDITARKWAEMELRRVKDRMETILNSASEGIYGVDAEGRTIFANRAAAEMLGWTQEEMLNSNQHEVSHHTRADGSPYPINECPIHRSHHDSRVYEVVDELFWRKDGTSFPVEYVSSPVTGPDGRVSGAMVVFRNVSERTRLLRQLERSNAELEQFAYVASHDLRQPLRMINSYTGLLERKLAEHLDDDTREFMHFVRDGATSMDRMLVSLLEYSRVGRKGQPMDWIDLGEALEEAIRFLAPDIEEARATIRVEGGWPEVFASQDEIVRLFQNLIGNAIKYRFPDRPPEIDITIEGAGREWRVTIRDNGIGIDPGQKHRLFQVFQRLHGPNEFEGTGIGLAVCRKIVERHGGRIHVESEGEGLGSRFVFTLPKGRLDSQEITPPQAGPEA